MPGRRRSCWCWRARGDATDAIDLLLVDTDAPGVSAGAAAVDGLGYPVQGPSSTDVQVPVANRLGAPSRAGATWEACMHEGIILLAAQAVGGAERALEITVEYSKGPRAVRQADRLPSRRWPTTWPMRSRSSRARKVLVLEAAWAHTKGKSIARLAPMAKLFACNTFRDVTAKCEQIHGGYGFTLEYDIQLFFRRAKQQQMNWWDSRYLENLIAAEVLDGTGRTIDDMFAV
jgi:alkylation response protein AidB-like acyl-CoA dehydrogenase